MYTQVVYITNKLELKIMSLMLQNAGMRENVHRKWHRFSKAKAARQKEQRQESQTSIANWQL